MAHIKGCSSDRTYPTRINYNRNYSPHIEARSCPSNYGLNRNTVYVIQSSCSQHSKRGTIKSINVNNGNLINAETINNLIDDINSELNRRNMGSSSLNKVNVGSETQSKIMRDIYNEIERMRTISNKNTPYNGSIMATSNPNPAIATLQSLAADCICYTDCGGYSTCYCYGYCNNY